MKKLLLIITMALCLCLPGYSQHKSKKSREELRKEYREYKMKVLAQEMDLKADQQKKFFELYNQMSDERHSVRHGLNDLNKKLKEGKNLSEEEYERLNQAVTEARDKDNEIEKKYDAEFKKFLTGKQIFKMKEAEEQFRRKMQEMRSKKQK